MQGNRGKIGQKILVWACTKISRNKPRKQRIDKCELTEPSPTINQTSQSMIMKKEHVS
jgi:aspartate carbamoyltransferase regulatory subunit